MKQRGWRRVEGRIARGRDAVRGQPERAVRRALEDVNLTVRRGERWAVIGPNGAGKTTLFRVIAGECAPSVGRVRMFARDVTGMPPNRRARLGMGRTYQVTNVFLPLTVRENVAIAAQAVRPGRLRSWWPVRMEGALGVPA